MRANAQRRWKLWFRSGGLLLAVAAVCGGQSEPHLRVDVGLVNVAFSVRDSEGAFIDGLTRDDFEVLEDGVPQRIQFFGTRSDLPLTIGLIEDFSDSQDHFNRQHRQDTQSFLTEALRAGDKAFLTCFGNHVRLVADLTDSTDTIDRNLQRFDHHPKDFAILGADEERMGGTALFDAIFFSSRNKMKFLTGRKALLVFSDGEDNSSQRSLDTAIEAAQGADALIYAVRYTEVKHHLLTPINVRGIAAMKRLADETGGRDFDAVAMDMKDVFGEIGRELRSLYELAYTSSNPARNGQFRSIEVRCRNRKYKVRARTGYYAR